MQAYEEIPIEIVNTSENPLPSYATPGDAGMDIRSAQHKIICRGETWVIKTGLYVAIPEGYELQVRSRSGLAAKHGIAVTNAPGTLDPGFRGEIGVILTNLSPDHNFTIKPGDRIAQLVLQKVPRINWIPRKSVEELPKSERGDHGFGSTGIK